ncbi:outer dense fiber protein 2-like isoform X2 [Argiope bruennichi]|nr:outer dense fiber protein 2-like isoform X2 [Argiope bruennichi]
MHSTEDRFDVASLSSTSSFNEDTSDVNVHLHFIKQEIQLLTKHFISLKQISQFLVGIFNTYETEDETIKDLLTKILDEVKEFIFNLDDLEYSVTLVENTISQEDRTAEFQKVTKLKENLLSKLLGSYSNIITIFQTYIQKQNSSRMLKNEEDKITLLNQLQESEQRCISQRAAIKDLERRLSIIQGKANTMESYKSTLEDTRTELQKQLSYKDAQIQYLTAELSQLSTKEKTDDNEKLLEIIEEIKKNAQAEKTALKKAVKFQKSRAEKLEQLHVRSEKELKEKEKMLLDIAAQRDQLKLHLTMANNSIIEGKNQIEEIKHQSLKLQNEMSEKEGDLKRQLQELSSSINEKSTQLNDCLREKVKLERDFSDVTNELEMAKRELNLLKSRFSEINMLKKDQGDGNNGSPLKEVKQLILLLQNTQEQLKNIKSAAINTTMAGGGDSTADGKTDGAYKTLLKAVDEIKEHLLDLKNRVLDSKDDNRKSELEMKLKELQKLYTSCSKENHALKDEIEELKNTRWNNSSQQNEISYMPENDFSAKTIQMELRLKNEENWRLKQREKDLEHQLEEVKNKLQKKDAENFRLYSLEEELKLRKNEISLLEKKKEEESERLLNRIKELQKALDETTAECDRLKRYVQDLRASYLNVFGGTS